MSPAAGFLERLDAVMARLEAHAGRRAQGVTEADPRTGERWDQGQIWAHVAEFIPYWIVEAGVVLAADEPPAFGRTQSDPGRIGEIARRRNEPPATLMATVREEEAALRELVAGLDASAWERRGIHPTLGSMTLTQLVEDFLVGHLEQHADQLDSLDSV
jgi:hypothetical protein